MDLTISLKPKKYAKPTVRLPAKIQLAGGAAATEKPYTKPSTKHCVKPCARPCTKIMRLLDHDFVWCIYERFHFLSEALANQKILFILQHETIGLYAEHVPREDALQLKYESRPTSGRVNSKMDLFLYGNGDTIDTTQIFKIIEDLKIEHIYVSYKPSNNRGNKTWIRSHGFWLK